MTLGTGPRPPPPLSALCLRLRNADPQVWDMFVAQFTIYTETATVALTEAAPADILVAQGRAQQCRGLLRIFKECDTSSSKPAP